ncbi:LysR family transcriptional regulator [Rhizobiales bacterium]|uniref:LysR family transcriptional regulator n=1 Tax=Hongsoonwoonella zoysiae TaxID=2821844 RepID=UPI001561A54A|nr:LysR family transcriptional regulator [Hongsoonwoonella zoysiae]NRG16110.1 LysR family transcriptional regulator [Hongsoonwoonella zoysiae]
MLTWDDYNLVLLISRKGTLSAAAKALNVNETTVSRRLAAAEERAGATLFTRRNRRLTPTAKGSVVVNSALAMENSLMGQKGDSEFLRGLVRVSSVSFVIDTLIAPLLPEFVARHPDITLELVPSNETASLALREADIGIRLARPERGKLAARKIGEVEFALAARRETEPEHFIAYERDLDDLPEIRKIREVYDGEPIARISSLQGIAQAAGAGLGAAMLPLATIAAHRELEPAEPAISVTRPLWLVVHEDLKSRATVRCVLDWLAKEIPRKLAQFEKSAGKGA